MARRYLAPQHRADATHRFISTDDSAWDADTLNRALEGVAGLQPIRDYIGGVTHYDLGSADFVELNAELSFLDVDAAEIWTVKPLPVEHRIEALDHIRRGRTAAAHALAYVQGVTKLEGATGEAGEALAETIAELPAPGRRSRKQTAKLLELTEAYAYAVVLDVGEAVVSVGDDRLSRAEGKA